MKTTSLFAFVLTTIGTVLSPSLAQPLLDPGVSRPMTEAELESVAHLWKTDPPVLEPILEQSFAVNLIGYGSIYFLSFYEQNPPDSSSVLTHWLVDSGHVRWELPQSEEVLPLSYTPLSLDAVVFTELNFDGLTDIYTIASYVTGVGPTGTIPFPIVTLYEQQDDGSFVILEETSIELSARGAANVSEVEQILREEMLFLP